MLIDTTDLALLRSTFNESLGDVCDVYRTEQGELVRDAGGGFTEPNGLYASGVPCRVTVPTGNERRIAEKITEEIISGVWFAWNADIRGRDRLRINGKEYRVQVVLRSEEYATTTRALCTKWNDDGE